MKPNTNGVELWFYMNHTILDRLQLTHGEKKLDIYVLLVLIGGEYENLTSTLLAVRTAGGHELATHLHK